jgi:hypothetical protein
MKNLFTICICLLTLTYLPGCIQSNESYLNEGASILKLEDLPENPLLLHPLTSSINPNDSTMATLYGNDLAMGHAQVYKGSDFPAGAVLYQVTWKQKKDSLWFGANIPAKVLSVEQISFDGYKNAVYKLYKGDELRESNRKDVVPDRVDLIISQRMAVSP